MRKVCLLIIAAAFSQFCFSQAQFGLKAGVNLNHLNVSNGPGSSFSSKPGFTIGATVDLKVSDNFYIQPELNYSYLALDEKDNQLTAKWKYGYINVPVLLKYKFNQSPVSIYVGPQLGFLTDASSTLNSNKSNIEDELANTDFSGIAGIDYKLTNGLRFDLRFQQSMMNFVKGQYSDPLKTRQQVFSLTIGYVFKSAKKD